ncbi:MULTISPECIES: DUF29 domain-containing protein [Yersinia pseudotuberculosis complex]|uniref:DUF29 domain-containing protein n=1 Tax=Yersinia pseudotuberculosis complex TaxID=1649845 RepID=UPI00034BECA2|nr:MULTISPECIES: DUF29 domain-containing protein [Yersinia pseudotuberculosis complex]AXY36098.1 DUF29 domain-containing protein [Yersinia pseudotuberculosis]MBO1566681.1 DUF29 family protein [Yersinia pseudotuberculosis]MBO1590127.1 DUF29 family protein [Yersinia pseudotuberculosis]MBO1603540.1 DUF29 family protein [Yersinia pseudotuberculosis]PEI15963.1 DUF29 domain-containing protein [Yersinia pseudotuberculosis]
MTNRYDTDFYGWTQEQADLLRYGLLDQLDTANLLKEIESIGHSQQSELESLLEVLFLHLLKWAFQPSHRGRSWQLIIAEQRRKAARRLSKSPSLERELDKMTTDAYGDAILSAARETGMDEKVFPKSCPWTFAQIMDSDFYPE